MASTSEIKKSQTRSAPSVNYSNDYYTQQTPRQILPMSRNTPQQQQRIFLPQNRSYTQAQSPQIIVPTQFGHPGDFSMNNISSSKDTYMSSSSMPNVPIDYYPSYYQNPIQPYPNYLQQQLMHPPQQQQQLQPQPIGPHQSQPDLLANTMHYVDMSRTAHQSTQQSPQIQSDINPQQPQQVLPTQVPSQHTLQQVVAQTVPTQSVQPPPLQPPTRRDFLRRDVFFSSAQSCDDDFMDSAQFDSDTSSDTEVFTPGRSNSPSLSPTSPASEFLGGEEEFRLFYNNESDDEEKKDSIAIIQQPSSRTSSSRKPSSKVTNKSSAFSTPGDELISSIFNSMELDSSKSINPMLLTNLNNDSLSPTVSDTAVTDATMSPRLTRTDSQPGQVVRPNHIEIEINNDVPSPPLQTPELISDTRTKRKASYISSDEGSSDSEMSVDKITKKVCDDNRTGIATALDSDSKQTRGSPIDVDDDSYVRPCDEQDEYTASSDSTSTDTEEDDDEEYRPSSSIKKHASAVKKFNTKAQQPRVKVSTPKTVASSPVTLPKAKTLSKSKSKTKNTSTRRSAKVTLKTSKKPTKPVTPNTPLVESPSPSESSLIDNELREEESTEQLETCDPCPTQSPTIFETLTQAGVDWCRYCGTTEGVNWRPGPWGKRTLCNKHGCDYKGYGFACKLPRLDLTGFVDEAVEKRDRPVLQLFCTVCHKQESYIGNVLVRCEGCPRAFHQKCHPTCIDDETVSSGELWYCERSCQDNLRRRRIVVELPRKRLPLMSTPKAQSSTSSESTQSTSTGTASRPRTSRNSTRP